MAWQFGKHHSPTMSDLNKKSCKLFVADLAFYNDSTLKDELWKEKMSAFKAAKKKIFTSVFLNVCGNDISLKFYGLIF